MRQSSRVMFLRAQYRNEIFMPAGMSLARAKQYSNHFSSYKPHIDISLGQINLNGLTYP